LFTKREAPDRARTGTLAALGLLLLSGGKPNRSLTRESLLTLDARQTHSRIAVFQTRSPADIDRGLRSAPRELKPELSNIKEAIGTKRKPRPHVRTVTQRLVGCIQ